MELLANLHLYQSKGKAIIAFNVQNINHIYILSRVANDLQVPIIAQLSQKYVALFDKVIGLSNLVKKYQNNHLTFHLDHCMDIGTIVLCSKAGFASVMYDGSSLPLDENIKNTLQLYKVVNAKGSLLEVELGSIKGVEDDFGSEEGDVFCEKELVIFARQAKYDMLALAIGNAHGNYHSTSNIKMELLGRAASLIGKQLFVLHGATGMPENMIEEAIAHGVVKINISTALKTETLEILKDYVVGKSEYNESAFFALLEKRLIGFFKNYITKFTV